MDNKPWKNLQRNLEYVGFITNKLFTLFRDIRIRICTYLDICSIDLHHCVPK
jgi:hypothetical protein